MCPIKECEISSVLKRMILKVLKMPTSCKISQKWLGVGQIYYNKKKKKFITSAVWKLMIIIHSEAFYMTLFWCPSFDRNKLSVLNIHGIWNIVIRLSFELFCRATIRALFQFSRGHRPYKSFSSIIKAKCLSSTATCLWWHMCQQICVYTVYAVAYN